VVNRIIKNNINRNTAVGLGVDYTVLFTLFSLLFLLQFIFREFLFYVAPFMPSSGVNMTALELVGTFSIFGLEVVIPFLLYLIRIPMRTVYLVILTTMLWGGTLLSFIYPGYYMTAPWLIGSIAVASLTMLSLIIVIYELGRRSTPLIPLIILQFASLILYVADVLTEYFALPLGGLGPYFVYPMLYLAGIGVLVLTAYTIYPLLTGRFNIKVLVGYIIAALVGFAMAYPLYQLTIYNSFMSHIMSMVFAMGLGVLAPPSYMPLLAVFMGMYIYAIIALSINGIVSKSPIMYTIAVASLIYLTTAFMTHALIATFASIVLVSNALIFINRWEKMGVR
jgi:hypothetical protein